MNINIYDGLRSQKGISLIEVMVAMVVIAVGFTSVTVLQMRSLQASHSSYQQSLAAVQAGDLVERLWAGVCVLDDADIRADILSEWTGAHSINTLMPGWTGSMNFVPATFTYNITISWTDRLDADTRTFNYAARIPVTACDVAAGGGI